MGERQRRGNGAQGRNRTTDTAIFNRMLYQLSYLGAREAVPKRAGRQRAGVIMGRTRPVQNGGAAVKPLRRKAEWLRAGAARRP